MLTCNDPPTTLSGVDIETGRSMVVGMIGDGGVAETRSVMTAAHSGLTDAEWRIVGPEDGRRVLDMMHPASVRSASYPFRLAWVENGTPHLLVAYPPDVAS